MYYDTVLAALCTETLHVRETLLERIPEFIIINQGIYIMFSTIFLLFKNLCSNYLYHGDDPLFQIGRMKFCQSCSNWV